MSDVQFSRNIFHITRNRISIGAELETNTFQRVKKE